MILYAVLYCQRTQTTLRGSTGTQTTDRSTGTVGANRCLPLHVFTRVRVHYSIQ